MMKIFKRYARFNQNEIPFFRDLNFTNKIEDGYEKYTVVYLGVTGLSITDLYINPKIYKVYVERTYSYDSLSVLMKKLTGNIIVENDLIIEAIKLQDNEVKILGVPEFNKVQLLNELMKIEIFELKDSRMPINEQYAYEYLFLGKERQEDILLKSLMIGREEND